MVHGRLRAAGQGQITVEPKTLGNFPVAVARPTPPTERECLQLWFSLAHRRWGTLVIVPADRDGSCAPLATMLADVGKRLSEWPISVIAIPNLDFGSARALTDLVQHVRRERERPTVQRGPVVEVTGKVIQEPEAETASSFRAEGASSVPVALPSAQVVISIPSVVKDPLGLGVVQSADAVVLQIDMGKTRFADARRTIELIGRERIAGCFVAW